MARTPTQVVESTFGNLMIQIAQLVAQVEALSEENATLKQSKPAPGAGVAGETDGR